jgi:hypothetical protein
LLPGLPIGAELGAMSLCFASLPIVAEGLVTALGGTWPPDLATAKNPDAIVILGGGVRPEAIDCGGDTLRRLTPERVRHGAYLARQTGLPVLVTGGAPDAGTRAEARLRQSARARSPHPAAQTGLRRQEPLGGLPLRQPLRLDELGRFRPKLRRVYRLWYAFHPSHPIVNSTNRWTTRFSAYLNCGTIRRRGIRSSPPAAVDSDSPQFPLVWL